MATKSLVKGNMFKGQFSRKRLFNCSSRKKSGCPFMLGIELYWAESNITVMWNDEHHCHNNRSVENAIGVAFRIAANASLAIQLWLKDDFIANHIHRKLRNTTFLAPQKSQLNNCIAYI